MKLWPVESVDNDLTVGGFIVEFESGIRKVVPWKQAAPILPTLDAAKEFTAKVIESLLKDRHMAEVEFTNWASATAAVQKIIMEWNDKQTQARYAADAAALISKQVH